MHDGFVKVAAATPDVRAADVAYNVEQICRQIDEASEAGAKIIVFPELCITGYSCGDLFLQQTLLDAAEEGLIAVIRFTGGLVRKSPEKEGELIPADPVVFVGLPMELDGKLYNVAAAIQAGRLLALIPKQNIPDDGAHHETAYFTAGNASPVPVEIGGDVVPFGTHTLIDASASVEGMVIGCEIGEDAGVYEAPHIALTKVGATVMVNLSASPEIIGARFFREEMVRHASARLMCAYLYASAGPSESTAAHVFSAHRMICENGKMLAESKPLAGGITVSEIDLQLLRTVRRRTGTFHALSASDDSYHREAIAFRTEETALTRRIPRTVFVPEEKAEREERAETVLTLLSLGLKKRMEHTGAKTAVIGISGGLDSTLALMAVCRTFDLCGMERRDICAVTMPGPGTGKQTIANARRLCEALGVVLKEIDISDAVGKHLKDIGHDGETQDVTFENAQARERTQVLMDLANLHGGLVIGTGDLSELALGWCTYNGDQMSMYGINADVPKTLIPHLLVHEAEHTDDGALREVIEDIIGMPVSPELLSSREGELTQKTEDILGPYVLHDFFLYHFLQGGSRPRRLFRLALHAFRGEDGFDRETVKRTLMTFLKRFFAQQFKRAALPEGVIIGSVTLSPRGGFTMPSDACGKLWIEEAEEL
ncbi:MAG: NAD(+) synthase [Lachnospiraceae bacterium]|nr:NAD(+) synthase [Lachnospiraceae bacterium]